MSHLVLPKFDEEMTKESILGLKGEMRAGLFLPNGGDIRIAGVGVELPDNAKRPVLFGGDTGAILRCEPGQELILTRKNAFVNIGLNNALDLLFALASPGVPSRIQLSSSTAAVTAATTTMGGTVSNKAISPAASRASQVVTAGATFTQADVAFVITKVGLLNTSTDAGTGLYDVIGGTGGSAPYNQPFTIDLTGTTSFSLTMQILVTAAAS